MKRFIIWGIIAISIFSIISETEWMWITWSGCIFSGPWSTIRGYSVFSNASCNIDWVWNITLWSGLTIWGWFSTTTDLSSLQSDKYGVIWFCTLTSCSWTWGSTNYTCGTIQCPAYWTQALLRTWPKGDIGWTGATGSTGSKGDTGSSAFELAQLQWYSGTISDWLYSLIWPTGATGTTTVQTEINFSWASFTWILMNNSVASGVLDQSGLYLPVSVSNNGTTYVNFWWVRNLIILLWILWLLIYGVYYFFSKKWNSLNL